MVPLMPHSGFYSQNQHVYDRANVSMKEASKKMLMSYVDRLKELQVPNAEVISLGPTSPRHAIDEFIAKRGVDLLVVGSRGRGAVKRMVLGSFCDYMVHSCTY
jgi:nucleotide-binding universal stress UspA family protein